MKYLRSVLGFVVIEILAWVLWIPFEFVMRWCYMRGFFDFDVTGVVVLDVVLFFVMLSVLWTILRYAAMISSFLGYAARGADGRMYVGGIVCGVFAIISAIWTFFSVMSNYGVHLLTVVKCVGDAYFGWQILWLSYCAPYADDVARQRKVDKYFGALR